jgi:hypothetical protein
MFYLKTILRNLLTRLSLCVAVLTVGVTFIICLPIVFVAVEMKKPVLAFASVLLACVVVTIHTVTHVELLYVVLGTHLLVSVVALINMATRILNLICECIISSMQYHGGAHIWHRIYKTRSIVAPRAIDHSYGSAYPSVHFRNIRSELAGNGPPTHNTGYGACSYIKVSRTSSESGTTPTIFDIIRQVVVAANPAPPMPAAPPAPPPPNQPIRHLDSRYLFNDGRR